LSTSRYKGHTLKYAIVYSTTLEPTKVMTIKKRW